MDSEDDRPKRRKPPLAALEAAEREGIGKAFVGMQPELIGWFRKNGVYPSEIDDVVAATYAKVWTGGNIDPRTLLETKRIGAVLFTAAGFVLGDIFTERTRDEQFAELRDDEPAGPADDPLAAAVFSDTKRAYERALASLSPTQREILTLADERYTNKEIAEMTGLPLQTVETYRKRGNRHVRDYMIEAGYEPGELEHDEHDDDEEQ